MSHHEGCHHWELVWLQEQYFIIKPKETSIRSFKIYPTTNQAAKYTCSGNLKHGHFSISGYFGLNFNETARQCLSH